MCDEIVTLRMNTDDDKPGPPPRALNDVGARCRRRRRVPPIVPQRGAAAPGRRMSPAVNPTSKRARANRRTLVAAAERIAAIGQGSGPPAELASALSLATATTAAELHLLEPIAGLPSEHLARRALLPAEAIAMSTRRATEQRLDDPHLSPAAHDELRATGKRRLLVLPLPGGDRLVGLAHLWTPGSTRAFSPATVTTATALTAQMGATLRALGERHTADLEHHHQSGLLRVSRAAVSSLVLPELLQEIAEATLGLAGIESCGIALWDPSTDELELGAEASIPDWPGVDPAGHLYPLDQWPEARGALVASAPVELSADVGQLESYVRVSPTGGDVQRLLMVPLFFDLERLGLLLLATRRREPFGVPNIAVAKQIADQTARALRLSHLHADAQRYALEQAALLQASQAIVAGGAIGTVVTEMARAAIGVAGVEACDIALWDPGSDETETLIEEKLTSWPGGTSPGSRIALRDWPSHRLALTARHLISVRADDPDLDPRERQSYAAYGVGAALIVPLLLGDECLGLLAFYTRLSRPFGAEAIRFGRDLAAQTAQALDRARLQHALQQRADTDGLTGLLNHRAIQGAIDDDLSHSREDGTPFAVVLADIDDFKLFNDTHGHQIGDEVLRRIATLFGSALPAGARIGRYGGDEFLASMPGLTAAAAHTWAARLLARAARTTIEVGDLRLPLKLSVGVGTFPDDGQHRQELIAAADAAMYRAKEAGGGQVGTEGPPTRSLEQSPYGALMGLILAVDRKDRYTRRHSDLVTAVAVRFAQDLGLPQEEVDALAIAGSRHDVGKIAVPDAILRKPGPLTSPELEVIRQHPLFSVMMVQGVPFQDKVQAAIAHHHERWDGAGYPHHRAGDQIPLLGRVLALADAYAAMVHDRPYRTGRTTAEAIAAIRAGSGSQFDPALTEPFVATISSVVLDTMLGAPGRKGTSLTLDTILV